MSEYTEQAENFLKQHGIKFKASMAPDNTCPLWCDGKHVHGNRHRITFSRDGNRFQIMFWNSLNDAPIRGVSPSAYDVLACLTKSDPGYFEDFCSEYGYDTDSRKALATHKAVVREWEKVSGFFTDDEITELYEIN